MAEDKKAAGKTEGQGAFSPPVISLPKGGGAIRGIGEKFAANPVTGTGSMSVPLAVSPGRSGFGPQLSLSYDSGSGNGPFGFGWSLALPSISRKTDKGLPLYQDAQESDTYVLSGVEDLVPVLRPDGTRHEDDTSAPGFTIHRYRPRIEGLFARIERWTNRATGVIHWRSITRDNVTTLYGKRVDSRILDPADPARDNPTRVFTWLICESYDDKGNAIVYEYAAENDEGVDLAQANERNRLRTAGHYVKRIKYGNRVSRLIRPDLSLAEWLFEVVFDYDELHYENLPLDPEKTEAEQHRFVRASSSPELPWDSPGRRWAVRPDPFSSYRAGFEVRTYRRCHQVLMFHRFPELGEEPCLVRSTEFDYRDLDYAQTVPIDAELAHQGSTRFASFIRSVTQFGFVRDGSRPVFVRDGVKYVTYLKKSLPPLEFEYSKSAIQEDVRTLDAGSLENLPEGLDGKTYQWVDLDGEGISGILTEQAGAWYYKENLGEGRFGPLRAVATRPSLASLASGRRQLLDLAGDGQLDLVSLTGPTPGFYERTPDGDWESFRPFKHLPNVPWDDPNLRFVDLNGDGHADVLLTEQDAFTWHPSLAENGFGPALKTSQTTDEERGPRLVLADGTQSIYLADMSGDGLTDLVRIRNGEICYWPNLGYGRFGAKVTMDNSPWLDTPDQLDQRRVRLADIDGSGTTDIIYLARDGVRIYFNQSGNRWSRVRNLPQLPHLDIASTAMTVDLLGNGTACVVWSSVLPGDARQPLLYIDLMGGRKPHLLVKSINNLGAETRLEYAPSTKFYLKDKLAGRPWITRIPFPVHVVERVETYDHISHNRFVTRYAYHHGYFDGVEREFRGFGMVEQFDTEEFAALNAGGEYPIGSNVEESSHVPPVLRKTWFHTGMCLGRDHVSDHFAGLKDADDPGEYYREPGLTDAQARALLLEDTVLPGNLSIEEEREACRALKGSTLRQEVYALDRSDKQRNPYTVTEHNFTIRMLQQKGPNPHGVFYAHGRESVSHHYERDDDARVIHALTLEVDDFGNVLASAAIGYGRLSTDMTLSPVDRARQSSILATFSEHRVTNAIDIIDEHRTPLPCESRTYELTGLTLSSGSKRLSFDEVLLVRSASLPLSYEEVPTAGAIQKRRIEHIRTYFRRNNLAGALPLGELQSLALPCETVKLALTQGLIAHVYGGRASDGMIRDEGCYVHSESDMDWWIPSGQIFYSPEPADTMAQELAFARHHFFLPHRYRDPFHTQGVTTESFITYDPHLILVQETRDALGNRVTAGDRNVDPTLPPVRLCQDYRVLKPSLVMDANRNRSEVRFDALGMVVATAVMGKPEDTPSVGDRLDAVFGSDLTQAEIDAFLSNPRGPLAATLLDEATTRAVYSMPGSMGETASAMMTPAVIVTLARRAHTSDPGSVVGWNIHTSLAYVDGFGREIQIKTQAEAGPVPMRDAADKVMVDANSQPQMTPYEVGPRWVGSGWTVFNNKGKPVRQYEPFFTDSHRFEFDVRIGVSVVLFYDPVERVVGTLRADHTWEKTRFDPWSQETHDVNDTVLVVDPKMDSDLGTHFRRLDTSGYSPSWHALRTDPAYASLAMQQWPNSMTREAERAAAEKASIHAGTPTVAHANSLGHTIVTTAHNALKYSDTPASAPVMEEVHRTRIAVDIEGRQRAITDASDRVVTRYEYDMIGNRIYQVSMDGGARWLLNDVAGKPLYTWNSREERIRIAYDQLRRPTDSFLSQSAGPELIVERSVYGESRPNPETGNLRGKVVETCDQAGVAINDEFDFKGNVLGSRRRFARTYRTILDWSGVVAQEPEVYVSRTSYDALNHPVERIAPDNSVVRLTYNDAKLLESVVANVRNARRDGQLTWTTFVNAIEYSAKGQRTQIDYGNGVRSTYSYDPMTSRLTSVISRRDPVMFPDDCPKPSSPAWPGSEIQQLRYTYDPAGNITQMRDDAQQAIYFRNNRIDPSTDYTYDAIYRLIEARGREHLGQAGVPPVPHSYNDVQRVGIDWSANDGRAMGRYTERYVYDMVGNLLEMIHRGSDPAAPGWSRSYDYEEPSLLEPDKKNNRLTRTTVGSITENYSINGDGFDVHGCMMRMPHLQDIRWNFKDQLRSTSRQAVGPMDADGAQHEGERSWYVYDFAGQRARIVTERKSGTVKAERYYLGGFEVYRQSGQSALVRETLHIADDKQRVALVESRTEGDEPGVPAERVRYHLSNHCGSVSVELDDLAQIISYEEYTPYGSTSYQAVRSQTETPKRYRFSGKERDDESGLYYHGARYYAPWLGRWLSADPKGLVDGTNVFAYARGNPLMYADATGTQCDPTMESCLDPSSPTLREEALQQSLPESERYLAPESIEPPSPPERPMARSSGRVISPPPPVSPTDYTLYVPQGFAYTQREEAIRGFENPDNPWWARGVLFVLAAAATPLALAEEYVARPVSNIPFVVHNAGIGIGEHIGRAVLWQQQGETGEAIVEGLEATVDFSEAFVTLGSVAEPFAARGGGRALPAVESRAAAATETEAVVIEGSGSARRVPPSQSSVPLPTAGESPMAYGTRAHQELPRIVSETNPGAGGRFNVAPGLTGPDLANPTGMNASFAEMKSLWGQQGPMVSQARNWGFDAQTGRYFFYDRNTGLVFEGIIQTEKFPSGAFRP